MEAEASHFSTATSMMSESIRKRSISIFFTLRFTGMSRTNLSPSSSSACSVSGASGTTFGAGMYISVGSGSGADSLILTISPCSFWANE